MKEIWNWKQIETILWNEPGDKWRKKERSGRVRQWWDKDMISICENIGKR